MPVIGGTVVQKQERQTSQSDVPIMLALGRIGLTFVAGDCLPKCLILQKPARCILGSFQACNDRLCRENQLQVRCFLCTTVV